MSLRAPSLRGCSSFDWSEIRHQAGFPGKPVWGVVIQRGRADGRRDATRKQHAEVVCSPSVITSNLKHDFNSSRKAELNLVSTTSPEFILTPLSVNKLLLHTDRDDCKHSRCTPDPQCRGPPTAERTAAPWPRPANVQQMSSKCPANVQQMSSNSQHDWDDWRETELQPDDQNWK